MLLIKMARKDKTKIQTLIFDRKYYFNKSRIKGWLSKHPEFKLMKGKRFPIEKTENTFRVRQRQPYLFKKSTFRTIKLNKTGTIKAVIGKFK